MRVAIEVAGFSPAESDGFRRAMGTWRSTREMEKLHRRFVDGCLRQPGMDEPTAEELFRQVAAFASFGFAKSHAAAFARTAYESSFLKLFYPAQFLAGLVNAQPMGFYPVEVLVNDAKRHGVAVLPGGRQRERLPHHHGVGRGRPRAAPSRCRHRPAPVAGPLAGLRHPVGRGARALGGRERDRLGCPARARPREGDRRGARRTARRGARPWAIPEPGRRRRADRAPRGGHRAAHPGGRARHAGAPPPRAPVAAPRGDGGERRADRRADDPDGGAGLEAGGRPPDRPAAAGDPGTGAARRSARSSGSATPTRSSRSTPGARSSGCSGRRSSGSGRSRTRSSTSAGPARSGSAGSSSPGSTR